MFHAGCPRNKEISAVPPSLSERSIRFGDVPEKASIDLKTGEIMIDRRYADGLTDTALEALLYHELAHLQPSGCARYCDAKPNGCERCADNRLGACMALAGHSRESSVRAFDDLRVTRATFKTDSLMGYDYINKSTTSQVTTAPVMSQAPTPVVRSPIPTEKDSVAEKPSSPVDNSTVVVLDDADACNYDYGWVVGVAGGLLSLSIVTTMWAVK